ncbi:MAG: ROK family glucokinase [Oscillospiraceae bacterium]|jgi:glucokinase|nr:ROK family glucokinase [Oscillospiraceae bacterium]
MRIGIDLGGTNIAAGLVDENQNITVRGSVRTPRGADDVVREMEALARSLCEQAGLRLQDITSAGIGSPGSIDTVAGTVIYANNLGFENVPLAGALAEALGIPVRIGNDANVAALGEFHAGAGKAFDSMVLVTLGTGVGGGIILGGKIYDGFNGMGGEIGHMVVKKDGAPCTCGRKGCWEAYASATGLIRLTKAALEKHPDSLMASIAEEMGRVSGRTAFRAARQGDAAGEEVVAEYLTYLACGAANLINLFQPAVLCFGGGVSHEGPYLIERLLPLVEDELYPVGEKKTALRLAELGNNAGIIGAALL